MKIAKVLLTFILVASAYAQSGKIGYTNLELIIGLMPEYKQIEKDLQQYQQKLQYAQTKLEEYQQLRQEGKLTPEQDKQYQEEYTLPKNIT